MKAVPLISIVDDDDSVRESLQGFLKSVGFAVAAFPSAEGLLESPLLSRTACLILDVRMPGMSGPELQQRLAVDRCRVPIVFISAHGDEVLRTRVIGDGAVDFLPKPFGEEALLGAVEAALRIGGKQ
jgi:FixJ family two-component response regulator